MNTLTALSDVLTQKVISKKRVLKMAFLPLVLSTEDLVMERAKTDSLFTRGSVCGKRRHPGGQAVSSTCFGNTQCLFPQ